MTSFLVYSNFFDIERVVENDGVLVTHTDNLSCLIKFL